MLEENTLPATIFRQLQSGAFSAGGLILLTGNRDCGKTSLCLELIGLARQAGITSVGLVSPGVYQEGEKVAIDLVDIASGERQRLAVWRNLAQHSSKNDFETLKWIFDAQALAWGNRILEQMPAAGLLILDEVGPLEFVNRGGLIAGMKHIDERTFSMALVVVRPELLEAAKVRWPWAYVIQLDAHQNWIEARS